MVANISFQNSSVSIEPVSQGPVELIPANPRGLVIYPDNNSRHRGFAFHRSGQSAQAGRKTRNRGAVTRNNFFDALEAVTQTQLDFVAYAGHGGRNSLPSAQVRERDLDRLQTQIQRLVRPGGIVLLYACQSGYAGGFASKLSRRLPTMAIWGHTDSGQASRNADKVVYRNGKGVDIRNVLTSDARSRFAGHLLSSNDFYARFAFMTQAAIEYELLSS